MERSVRWPLSSSARQRSTRSISRSIVWHARIVVLADGTPAREAEAAAVFRDGWAGRVLLLSEGDPEARKAPLVPRGVPDSAIPVIRGHPAEILGELQLVEKRCPGRVRPDDRGQFQVPHPASPRGVAAGQRWTPCADRTTCTRRQLRSDRMVARCPGDARSRVRVSRAAGAGALTAIAFASWVAPDRLLVGALWSEFGSRGTASSVTRQSAKTAPANSARVDLDRGATSLATVSQPRR